MTPATVAALFWARVDKSGDCWEWRGRKHDRRRGYGAFDVDGRTVRAHRFAVELTSGPIPAGHVVLHRCDNPSCVRPDHLIVGTQADNVRDCEVKGRSRHPSGADNGALTRPETRARGERNGWCHLSDRHVARIRALYAAGGVRQRDLAEMFATTQAHVSRIVRGEIRKEAA